MRAWIDPEVVELAGISDEELSRYLQPADYVDQGRAAAGRRAPNPHMSNYPPGVYERILGVSDERMLASSENQPPVEVA